MNFEDRVGPQDEAAAALFAAARAYRPPARALRRALRALGLPVGIALLASSAAQGAVAFLSVKGVVVLAVVVVAGAGALGGAAHLGARGQRTAAKAPGELTLARMAAPAPATTVVVVPAEDGDGSDTTATTTAFATTSRSGSTSGSTSTSTSIATAASPSKGKGRGVALKTVVATQEEGPHAAPEPPPMAERVSALQAELRLIGEARGDLRAGDARGALLVLDEHARRFPAGAMVEEVELLQMRALVAAGEGERARGLGGAFLARRPHSPLAGAVRSLFGFPNPRGQEGDRR